MRVRGFGPSQNRASLWDAEKFQLTSSMWSLLWRRYRFGFSFHLLFFLFFLVVVLEPGCSICEHVFYHAFRFVPGRVTDRFGELAVGAARHCVRVLFRPSFAGVACSLLRDSALASRVPARSIGLSRSHDRLFGLDIRETGGKLVSLETAAFSHPSVNKRVPTICFR